MDEFKIIVEELDATLEKAQELVKKLGQKMVDSGRVDSRGSLPNLFDEINQMRFHMNRFVSGLWSPEFLASNFNENYMKRFSLNVDRTSDL